MSKRLTCCEETYCCIHRKDENINKTTLIVEGRKLYICKDILALASPVFYAMFYSGFRESTANEIPIQGVKYEDFEQFLQLIYGGTEKIIDSNCINILELADRFAVGRVREKCEQPLIDATNLSDKQMLIYAERYRLSIVQAHVLNSMTIQKLQALAEDISGFGRETLGKLFQKALLLCHKKHDDSSRRDSPPRSSYRGRGGFRGGDRRGFRGFRGARGRKH